VRRGILFYFIDPTLFQPLQKQLHHHILALVPTAKIESTRFRSVAFKTPTSKLPQESDEASKNTQPRQHERDRASSWRAAQVTDEATKKDEKKFLTPSQKKRIAFINHEIHTNADSVHAYIVFAYPQPADSRPANLPPPPPVMDPFEAARVAVENCNGTVFLDRMLRVDAVAKSSTAAQSSDSTLLSSAVGDPKLTIFVGNLDFASSEEDLRVYFEGVVSAERGPPSAELSQDGDKPKFWVTRVRMIRDRDTQLGKGFAYVQFAVCTIFNLAIKLLKWSSGSDLRG
jgi:nucleolar protein 12